MPPPPPSAASGRSWGTQSRLLIALIQVGSLLATGWLVWWAALMPRFERHSLLTVLVQVLAYTLLAWAWSVAVALALYAIVPMDDRSGMVEDILRTSATAVWFGPAMILLSNFSLASLLPALVLVVYASRLLYAQWRPATGGPPQARAYVAREPGRFADCQLPQGFVWRERLPAIGVAICLEAGSVAVMAHCPLLGAAFFCAGTAVLTVFSMATGAASAGQPPTLPKSIVGILATIVLASLMTMGSGGSGGGMLGIRSASGAGHPSLVETARAVLRQLFYGESPAGESGGGPAGRYTPAAENTGASGGFAGVILWPEIKPVTTLIAPLPALGSNPFQGRPAQPLSIPFGGEYWMFRWPFAHPPLSSFRERGTPSKLAFSTTDHTPLQMEAHQKLETPIDLGCCSGIQVEVINADLYAGTLTLELVLLNTDNGASESLSLGSQLVSSHPDATRDPVTPVRETLTFRMAPQSSMEQFTELKVVFHRASKRLDKSAKVSVERFILQPR